MRLSANNDFQDFLEWFDIQHDACVTAAVMGVDQNFNADVLRGRAQALTVLKNELQTAPEIATRIQKVG